MLCQLDKQGHSVLLQYLRCSSRQTSLTSRLLLSYAPRYQILHMRNTDTHICILTGSAGLHVAACLAAYMSLALWYRQLSLMRSVREVPS